MDGEVSGARRRGVSLALGIGAAAVVSVLIDSWALLVLATIFAVSVVYVFASLSDDQDDEDPF